jgi:ABC-type lipopolysaccharide export system ATPase subunit
MAARILQNVNPMSEILRARNLIKNYGDKIVVNDVDIDVHGGEIVGLLRPNGAGKTTICYMIVGLVEASAGKSFSRRCGRYRIPPI